MYRWDDGSWSCNCEILRLEREQIAKMPAEEAAYEIALSALFRHIAQNKDFVYTGPTTPVTTTRGNTVGVPTHAFDLAKQLVPKVVKILADGGGNLNIGVIGRAKEQLARSLGVAVTEIEGAVPTALSAQVRRKAGLEFAAQDNKRRAAAMANRRKQLAHFWFKHKHGFLRRGLVCSVDQHGLRTFNVDAEFVPVEVADTDSEDFLAMVAIVSRAAIDMFATASNTQKGDERGLHVHKYEASIDDALTVEIRDGAAALLSEYLVKTLQHRHGIVGLRAIETSLVRAWDPEGVKDPDEYPFAQAPSATSADLDRWAMDTLREKHHRRVAVGKHQAGSATPAIMATRASDDQPPLDDQPSWRDDLDIVDWIPLDEEVLDDETLDRRAMAIAMATSKP